MVDELEAANVLYVVCGSGPNNQGLDECSEPEMQEFTPWAGRPLAAEEWVSTFSGDVAAHAEGDPSVVGFRKLERSEVLQWRDLRP